jgi:hypothetical protein
MKCEYHKTINALAHKNDLLFNCCCEVDESINEMHFEAFLSTLVQQLCECMINQKFSNRVSENKLKSFNCF